MLSPLRSATFTCLSRKFRKAYQLHAHKALSQGIATVNDSFMFSNLDINLVKKSNKKKIPDENSLLFGKQFSDHMLEIEWTESKGWSKPVICPFHNLTLHPAAKVLHYAQELFEGLKAYRTSDGKILLFRPELNVERLLTTAERAALPLFDKNEFLKCVKKLISIEKDWVPYGESSALYIRPTIVGTEPCLGVAASKTALLYVITGPVSSYFASGTAETISLLADPNYVRAWPGGVGHKKMGSNYAPTIYVQKKAEQQNLNQVLWLFGENHQLAEIGTMNIFVHLIDSKGDMELVTPPLDGTILPGITRQSLLELSREWNEFKVSERPITMQEIINCQNENRLLEIFGCGTACGIAPVSSITYLGMKLEIPTMKAHKPLYLRFFKTLENIQYGKEPSDWVVPIE